MFENLRNAIDAHYNTKGEEFCEKLARVTVREALNSWYFRDMMTPAAHEAAKTLNPDDILPESITAKMVKRFVRKTEKERAARLHKLEMAENMELPTTCSVVVTWARSRTWGMNPTATVMADYAYNQQTTGHASGCGYDKESTAIADAINANPAIMRILYEHAEVGKSFPYSVYVYAGLPYFDGGCGVSCFRNVFEACGYSWKDVSHTKTSDVYMLEKGVKRND